jgi:hypothetical protein
MKTIEEMFKEIVESNFKHTSCDDHFGGFNYIDISFNDFIFNLTLEKKDETHFAVSIWGLAHKTQLGKGETQFHGEHYKIITNKISKKELEEKIKLLVKESFDRHLKK